jgi:hypothetical protein
MLDYTKAIFSKTKKDLDTALTFFQLGTQILYLIYLSCILFTQSEIWYLYLSLLIVSGAFFIFDITTRSGIKSLKELGIPIFGSNEHKKKLQQAKKKRNNIRKIKFYLSHTLKLAVLTSSLYPIIASPYNVHPIHIICSTVMILLWIMQIVLEIMRLIFEGRLELFYEAMHADIEFITKPVNSVKNAFKRLVGKEVEEPMEPTKERVYLDGLVEERKAEKAAAKKAAKAEMEDEGEEPKTKKERISDWLESRIFGLNRNKRIEEDEDDFVTVADDSASDDDK